MSNQKPRPNLNLDKEYLNKVSNLFSTKKELEDIKFEYLSDLLMSIGFDQNIYDIYLHEENKEKIQEIVDKSFEIINTQKISEDIENRLSQMWSYLSEEDLLKKADLIFVFGSISQLVVLEAIKLKKDGWAPKILFSGKRASYSNDIEMPEAEIYKQLALENGISEEDILIEKDSVNTPENIVKSAQLLKEINYIPRTVIAVGLPYHMKRASLTMRSGFDWNPQIIRHPGQSVKYTKNNYFKDKNGWSYVFFEYLKLYGARKMKHF